MAMTETRDSDQDAPMNAKTQSPADDLAFMRALVEDRGGLSAEFGEAYLAGGVIYGLQILIQSLPSLPGGWMAIAGIAPTFVFAAVLTWIIWRHRHVRAGSLTSRAVGTAFGIFGLANLAMMCVIGPVALRHRSLEIWLIYPCVVFVLQGACWLLAAGLRKRIWHAVVGIGWFCTAILMAAYVQWPGAYGLIAGIGLIAFMAVPGAVTLRLAAAQR
jgi:hypothetical protein